MKHTVEEIKLKNGACGLFIDVPGATTMCMEFQFRAGNRYSKKKDIWEVAHILEHMVYGDSSNFKTKQDFEYEFTKNGAYSNAFTSDYVMTYVADCADFEWARVMELQRQVICSPRLNEEKLVAEKGNIRSELTNYINDHERLLYPRVSQLMGEDILTYRQRLQTINNVTLADIREHHRRTHTTNNLRFVIAGKIKNRKTQIKQILELFDLPKGERFEFQHDELTKPEPCVIRRKDATNLTFGLFMAIPRTLNDDDIYAMHYLNHILTGTFHSRIFGEARKRGIIYDISSGINSGIYDSNWCITGQVNHEYAGEVFDLIAKELKRVIDGKISHKEIEAAKSFALGRHQMGAQTVAQISDFYDDRYFEDGFIKNYDKIPERIERVSAERMIETARGFFAEDLWLVAAVSNGERQEIADLSDKLATLFEPR